MSDSFKMNFTVKKMQIKAEENERESKFLTQIVTYSCIGETDLYWEVYKISPGHHRSRTYDTYVEAFREYQKEWKNDYSYSSS